MISQIPKPAMTELTRRNRNYCLAITEGFVAGRRQTDDGLLCHVQRSQVRIGFRDSWKLVCQCFFKFDCVHQITFVVALALNAWGYSAGHRSPFRRAPARYVGLQRKLQSMEKRPGIDPHFLSCILRATSAPRHEDNLLHSNGNCPQLWSGYNELP